MRLKVYKSLDESSSTFGLKGSYFKIALGGAVAALAVAVMVGKALNGLVGLVVFLVLVLAVYFGVLAFQAKYSERERKKWMCVRKLPDFVAVEPVMMRDYIEIDLGMPEGGPR